jgi:hypothetical protein
MWSNTTNKWTVQVFHGINRHIYSMVTRVPIIVMNHAFAKIMSQVIRLEANFSEHRIQSIRLDNVTEFSSQAFNDYCITQVIQVQHYMPYIYT